ncbi:NADH-quinone oxidoreductase subunit H [Methanocaldococcus indicus]|uniref:NADH-quinone oxidoreductase subunit H n=1 Tax=Methanocaldococcus indicus TaxID=213231 RepID=UPI003C6D7AC5
MELYYYLYYFLSIVGIPSIYFVLSTLIPGIQRKIQARIQWRVGPSILAPGFWAFFKFIYKEIKKPDAILPNVYNIFPMLSIIILWVLLVATTLNISILSNIIFIAGILKLEELFYVIKGSLSCSIMGFRMPYIDECKGAKYIGINKISLEQLSAIRNYKFITIASFPFYISLFLPFFVSKTIYLSNLKTPFILSLSGLLGALIFFISYLIMIKEYPFSITHTKADVIDGTSMELIAKYRALYLCGYEFLIIVLGSLFSTIYLGCPPTFENPISLIINIVVSLILAIFAGIVKAFSPFLTFKELYNVSFTLIIIGALAYILALIGL